MTKTSGFVKTFIPINVAGSSSFLNDTTQEETLTVSVSFAAFDSTSLNWLETDVTLPDRLIS